MMVAKFNIGDIVSTIPEGQVCCDAYRIGTYNTGTHAFKLLPIIETFFNVGEWWYRVTENGNWYNESGLVKENEEIKNYEIY